MTARLIRGLQRACHGGPICLQGALLALACSSALLPGLVAAQPAQARQLATAEEPAAGQPVLLLRVGASVRTPLVVQTERALAGALSELGSAVATSPLWFQDAQLVAGCSGTLQACGSQVAQVLESEHLAVAVLERAPGAASAELQLFVFESGGDVRHGSAALPASGKPIEPSVRDLVQRVMGGGEAGAGASAQVPVSAAAPPAPRERTAPARADARRERTLKAVGWTALGVGSAALVGALATSIAARDAGQAYVQADVRSREDADRALSDYDSAERRTQAARVLWGVGAGTAAAGAFVLLWQHYARPADRNLQASEARRHVAWAAMPTAAGASFSLSSAF